MHRALAYLGTDRGSRRAARLLAAAVLAASLLAGCARVTESAAGQKEELSDSEVVAFELEQSIGLVKDPALVAYIESVGTRVAAKAKRKDIDYRFKILDLAAPNALALPDGQIFVSRGVLILVNSEDELASILAHEVAHVDEHHASARENLALVTSPIRLGTGIAGWATGLIVPGLGDAIIELGESTTGLLLAPYSREQEREADRVGQSLVAAAGYDPEGLVNLLDTMAKAEALEPQPEGAGDARGWFATHPATSERVEATRAYGKTLTPASRPAAARDRAGVLTALEGLVLGEDPGKGFFDENWFVHPELAFVMGFPPGWESINSGGFVGAKKDGEEIFVMLALVAPGTDPLAGAKAASRRLETDLVSNARTGRINGLPAAKNRVQLTDDAGREQLAELTWIAHGGRIYQVMAVAPAERYEAVAAIMGRSAASFRVLTYEERSSIQVLKLHVVEGRPGETVAELAERVHTPLTVDTVSIINRTPAGAPLEAGARIKVGITENYAAEPRVPFARPATR